jgi:hypothetical protein
LYLAFELGWTELKLAFTTGQVLRSGPRRLLAASLSDRRRHPERDCGFGQH